MADNRICAQNERERERNSTKTHMLCKNVTSLQIRRKKTVGGIGYCGGGLVDSH